MKNILSKKALILLLQFSCSNIKMSGSSGALLSANQSSNLHSVLLNSWCASGGTRAVEGWGPQTVWRQLTISDKWLLITRLECLGTLLPKLLSYLWKHTLWGNWGEETGNLVSILSNWWTNNMNCLFFLLWSWWWSWLLGLEMHSSNLGMSVYSIFVSGLFPAI